MTDDLVKRLRTDINETDTFERRKNWTEQRSERRKAADRIEDLTAENERLREALREVIEYPASDFIEGSALRKAYDALGTKK